MENVQTTKLDELIARMGGTALVVDAVTDEHHTSKKIRVVPLHLVEEQQADPLSGSATMELATEEITDQAVIRALYDHPSATAYGDGSYTVSHAG